MGEELNVSEGTFSKREMRDGGKYLCFVDMSTMDGVSEKPNRKHQSLRV